MGITLEEKETNLVWDYSEKKVRGYTTESHIANHWVKLFGSECVKPLGHGYQLETDINNVKKPWQIKRSERTMTDEQKKASAERLKLARGLLS